MARQREAETQRQLAAASSPKPKPASRAKKEMPPLAAGAEAAVALSYALEACDAKQLAAPVLVALLNLLRKQGYASLELPDEAARNTAISKALEQLPLLKAVLERGAAATIESCVAMAFATFHQLFRDKIVDLTTAYVREGGGAGPTGKWY